MANERKKQYKHVCVLCAAIAEGIAEPHAHSCTYLVIAQGPLVDLVPEREKQEFIQRAIYLSELTSELIRQLAPAVGSGTVPRFWSVAPRDGFKYQCVLCLATARGQLNQYDHSCGYLLIATGAGIEKVTLEERTEYIQYALHYAGFTPDRIRAIKRRAIRHTTMAIPLVLAGTPPRAHKSVRLEMTGSPRTNPPDKTRG